MPDPRIKEKDIFKESNMLLLKNSLLFQDTTMIEGSYFTPCTRKYERRFLGYVYKCVHDAMVPYLFESGISPAMCDIESEEYPFWGIKEPGKTYGYALKNLSAPAGQGLEPCLVTYISHYQACYSYPTLPVCLIDIRELGGIVYSGPWSKRYSGTIGKRNNIYASTKEVFGIVITYPVSKSRIVGVIKPLSLLRRLLHPQQLKLYVNPEYDGGMEGARAVAASFNGGSEWVMVDA